MNRDSGYTHVGPWVRGSSWTFNIPDEQYGNWEWYVTANNGVRSEAHTFVFNPFPGLGNGGGNGDGVVFSRYDFNRDCRINLDDFHMLEAVYLTDVPPTDPKFDLNGDGKIDHQDLAIWLAQYTEEDKVYCTLP